MVSEIHPLTRRHLIDFFTASEKELTKDKENAAASSTISNDSGGDALDEINLHMAVCLHWPKYPALVREHLDAGALAKAIKRYSPPGNRRRPWTDRQYSLILIAGCAMELGCTFPPGFINDLRSNYQRIELFPEAAKEIEVACNEYINGKPYCLGTSQSDETGKWRNDDRPQASQPELEAVPAKDKFKPSDGAENDPRIIPYRFWFPPGTCRNCGAEKGPNGTELMRCSDCHQALFCCSGCLRWGYLSHSKDCDKEKVKQRREDWLTAAKAAEDAEDSL